MRARFFLLFLAILLWGETSRAQYTTVTGQVTDSTGIPYAGARMTAGLVFAGTPSSNPTVQISGLAACQANGFASSPCQVPIAQINGPFSLDGNGNIPGGGITLPDNTKVTPPGTTWSFTVNETGTPPPVGTGPQTCNATLTISGVSQVITSSFSACPLLSHSSSGIASSAGTPGSCPVPLTIDTTTGKIYSDLTGTCVLVGPGTGTAAGGTGAIDYTQSSAFAGTSNTLLCNSAMAGTDMGAKINTCTAALAAGGGTADASELKGAQTLSTAVAVPTGVTLKFGSNTQISQSANISCATLNCAISGPWDRTAIFTKAANIDQFTLSGVNAYARNLNLAGVGGTFTGNGIVESNGTAVAEYNIVSGEAACGISETAEIAQFNIVSSSAVGGHAICGGGGVLNNTVTGNAGDVIFISNGNNTHVSHNTVNLSPSSGATGLCGINWKSDQIGGRNDNNTVNVNDTTNSGNIDYGICDTPQGSHNLDMVFEADHVVGTFSGSVTDYGYYVNNAAGLNTGWSVKFVNETTVHVGAPTSGGSFAKNVDANSNLVVWEDLQLGDGSTIFDANTTSNGNLFHINSNPGPFSLATLPTHAAVGSYALCSSCTRQAATGGGGTEVFVVPGLTNGHWVGVPVEAWTNTNANNLSSNASATSVAHALSKPNHDGDTNIVGLKCTATGSPTLTVSDNINGSYTQDFAPVSDGANHWISLFRLNNAFAATPTITASSSGNTCTYIEMIVTPYAFVGTPDGSGTSSTGTGTAMTVGPITATPGDLIVAMFDNTVGGINPGSGNGCGSTSRGGDFQSILEDLTLSSTAGNIVTGSVSPCATASASDPWVAFTFAYKLQ